jgi:hypothetical protein
MATFELLGADQREKVSLSRKNRGAEAPQSEATEALFHLNRRRRQEKSCPRKKETGVGIEKKWW